MSPRRYQPELNSSTSSGALSSSGGGVMEGGGSCLMSAAFAALPKRVANTPAAAIFKILRIKYILRLLAGLWAAPNPHLNSRSATCSPFTHDRRRIERRRGVNRRRRLIHHGLRRWRRRFIAAGPAQTQFDVVRVDVFEGGRVI